MTLKDRLSVRGGHLRPPVVLGQVGHRALQADDTTIVRFNAPKYRYQLVPVYVR